MSQNVPRVMFAAASSGCGKTTVTCAVLQALKNREGLTASPLSAARTISTRCFIGRRWGLLPATLICFLQKGTDGALSAAKNSQGKGFCPDRRGDGLLRRDLHQGVCFLVVPCQSDQKPRPSSFWIAEVCPLRLRHSFLGYLSFEEQSQIRGVILNPDQQRIVSRNQRTDRKPLYKHHRLRIYAEDAGLFAGKQTSWACEPQVRWLI